MFHRLRALFKNDRGQDLAEYCLILALICLVALGILFQISGGVKGIWATAGNMAAAGNTAAGGGAATPAAASQPAGDHDGGHDGGNHSDGRGDGGTRR